MFKLADRTKESTITQGVGNVVLQGAFGGFQSFADAIGDGNSTYYTIENNDQFEIGIGTYSSSSNSLSRDTVFNSSNSNNKIILQGVSTVFCTYPASQAVFLDRGFINALSPQYSGILFPDTTIINSAFLSGVVPSSTLPNNIVYTNDSRLSDTRVPKPHVHPISEITSLQAALDSKQPSGSYAQSVHSHAISDVQGLQVALDSKQPSGSYATLNHSHLIVDVSGLQAALDSKQPSGNYAPSSHAHTSSNITDFNSAVSGLLPVKNITPSSYISIISTTGNFTISVTGLQPAGSYASSVHSHSISDVTGLQTALDEKQPSGNYASSSHTHTSSQITDFNTSVSGLINGIYAPLNNPTFTGTVNGITKSMVGLGNVDNTSDANKPISSATQTALDGKAALSHTHTSSQITDFNSSVSGILPVKNIQAGTGIVISSTTGNFTINSNQQASSIYTTVFNKTGNDIPKMSVVYINGGQGDIPTVTLSIASSESTSSKTYGITSDLISNMSSGQVIVNGSLTGVNTDQFNPSAPQGDINGTTLWLSPTISGGITVTKPSAPNHMVSLGTVVRTHQNAGIIEVKIQNGFELEELHNVAISGISNNQIIKYDSATSLWKNNTLISSDVSDFNSSVSGILPVKNLTAGTNIQIVSTTGNYTISVTGISGGGSSSASDLTTGTLNDARLSFVPIHPFLLMGG